MFVLGDDNGTETLITEDQTSNEEVIVINKGVLLQANLTLTNRYYRAEVKGIFKEFGYGNPLVNSYITIQQADSYLSARYLDWAALSNDLKSQHILIGSRYLESNFEFIGEKLKPTQALSFPRRLANEQLIPKQIIDVACECAYMAFKLKLLPTNSTTTSASNVTEEKKKVGPIETLIKYDVSQKSTLAGEQGSSSYTYIEKLLKGFITKQSNGQVSSKFALDY